MENKHFVAISEGRKNSAAPFPEKELLEYLIHDEDLSEAFLILIERIASETNGLYISYISLDSPGNDETWRIDDIFKSVSYAVSEILGLYVKINSSQTYNKYIGQPNLIPVHFNDPIVLKKIIDSISKLMSVGNYLVHFSFSDIHSKRPIAQLQDSFINFRNDVMELLPSSTK